MSDRAARWRQIERLCQEALDRRPAERASFLDAACGQDIVLRHEVEALLKHEAAGSAFLEQPAGAVAAAVMAPATRELSGHHVGVFDVGPLLGVGGMGEVYRARDTNLQRDVALKVLPADVAADLDRLARFAREAQALAALNHPNIAAIYGFEKAGDIQALILELVEGPTLADRVARGPIPHEDARVIALQIAEALEAAHEHGIVHRDLKPANIKLRPDGVVKVLDFGLAKAMDVAAPSADVAAAPTITSPAMTRAGVLLGTAAYMSPEQARGRPADTRSDVWAFGAVLFEMLSGQRAFPGDEIADTLAAVLRADPDWDALPVDTPQSLRRLLRRSLQKDAKQRLQHIGDARLELTEVEPSVPVAPPARRRVWPLAVATAVVAGVLGGVAWTLAERRTDPPVRRFSIPIDPSRSNLALSPNGRTLVWEVGGAQPGLVARQLDGLASEPIRGTERGTAPFFSPDGAWIGFFADGKLKKVPAGGGTAITVCDAPPNGHGTWGDDGTIVVARPYLYRVASTGGTLEQVLGGEGEQFYLPQFVPGSNTVLVDTTRPPNPARIEAVDLSTRARHQLLDGASPRLAPGGHLLFARPGGIWATRFDATRLAVVGSPTQVVASFGQVSGLPGTSFVTSNDGSLVYFAGEATRSLVWLDRTGQPTPVLASAMGMRTPRLAPDGTSVAVDVLSPSGNADVWIIDAERGSRLRLTTSGYNRPATWSPDGTRIAFFSSTTTQRADDDQDVFVIPSAGGEPTRLLARPGAQWPVSWSPDGRFLTFEDGPGFSRDLWVLPLGEEPRPLAVTRFNERGGVFSPAGGAIAFVTDESGRDEVYVQPFPGSGAKVPISSNGGVQPVWARNGRELFYREGDVLMVVSVQRSPFRASAARTLFDMPRANYGADPYGAEYDVAPDGRFLTVRQEARQEIHVVLNWAQELRRALHR